MLDILFQYLLFLLQTATVVVAIVIVVGIVAANSQSDSSPDKGRIEVKSLNDYYDNLRDRVKCAITEPETLKAQQKLEKKKTKQDAKVAKKEAKKQASNDEDTESTAGNVYVLDFDGDIKAAEVESLREEISAVLSMATEGDEVVIRLESGGGIVHCYGFASSQLSRITAKGVKLTACIDRVAASGGYMMAAVADKLIAAPFAVIGSVGVVGQIPNFYRLLKKHDVDVEIHTAGQHKRTLTLFGENTDEDRAKFNQELEDTHKLFKDFVSSARPQLDIDHIATGEVWYGQQALEEKLVDEIGTSDEYIMGACADKKVYSISYVEKKSVAERMGLAAESGVHRAVISVLGQLRSHLWR